MSCSVCKKIKIIIESNVKLKKVLLENKIDVPLLNKSVEVIVNKYSNKIKSAVKQNTNDIFESTLKSDKIDYSKVVERNKSLHEEITKDEDLIKSVINTMKLKSFSGDFNNDEELQYNALLETNLVLANVANAYITAAGLVAYYYCGMVPYEIVSSMNEAILANIANQLGGILPPEGQSKDTRLPTVDKCPTGSTLKYGPAPICYDRGGTPVAIYEEPKPSSPSSRPDVMITKESKKPNRIKLIITENKKKRLLKEEAVSKQIGDLIAGFVVRMRGALKGLAKGEAVNIGETFIRSFEEAITKTIDSLPPNLQRSAYELIETEFAAVKKEIKDKEGILGEGWAKLDEIIIRKKKAAEEAIEAAKRSADDVADSATDVTKSTSREFWDKFSNSAFFTSKTARALYWNTPTLVSAICGVGTFLIVLGKTADFIWVKLTGAKSVAAVVVGAVVGFWSSIRAAAIGSGKLDYGKVIKGWINSFARLNGNEKLGVLVRGVLGGYLCLESIEAGVKEAILMSGVSLLKQEIDDSIKESAAKYKLTPEQIEELKFTTNPFDEHTTSGKIGNILTLIAPAGVPFFVWRQLLPKAHITFLQTDFDRLVDNVDIQGAVQSMASAAGRAAASTVAKMTPEDKASFNNDMKKVVDLIPAPVTKTFKFIFAIYQYQLIKNGDKIEKFEITINDKKVTGQGAYLLCTLSKTLGEKGRSFLNNFIDFIIIQKPYLDNEKDDTKLSSEYINNVFKFFGLDSYTKTDTEAALRLRNSEEYSTFMKTFRKIVDEFNSAFNQVGVDKELLIKYVSIACSAKEAEMKELFNTDYKGDVDLFTWLKQYKEEKETKGDATANPFYREYTDDKNQNRKTGIYKLKKDSDGKLIPDKTEIYYIYDLKGADMISIYETDKETPYKNENGIVYFKANRFISANTSIEAPSSQTPTGK